MGRVKKWPHPSILDSCTRICAKVRVLFAFPRTARSRIRDPDSSRLWKQTKKHGIVAFPAVPDLSVLVSDYNTCHSSFPTQREATVELWKESMTKATMLLDTAKQIRVNYFVVLHSKVAVFCDHPKLKRWAWLMAAKASCRNLVTPFLWFSWWCSRPMLWGTIQ